MTTDTIIDDLRDDLAARLASDEALADLPIVTERSGDILGEVAMALGIAEGRPGRRGICLVILQISARPETPEVPNPPLILQPVVRVLEHPILNDTGTTALAVARRIMRVLHHYAPDGLTSCLVADSPSITGVVDEIAPLAYDVAFRCMDDDRSEVGKVAIPTIWPESGEASAEAPLVVSLACDTEGAEIRYTLDGSPPYRSNPAANAYDSTITLNSPCTLRVAAWKSGLLTSDSRIAIYS